MDHIERFEDLASSIKANGVPEDYLFCKLFPYSLSGDAAYWLKQLAPGSLTTWEDTKSAFIANFFDETRSEDIRMKISTFRQGPTEAFKAAWGRFKSYQRDCPHHGFSDAQLLGIFFRGIDWRHQSALDSASKGNFNTNTPEDALALIENMAASSSTKNIDFERKQLGGSIDGGKMAKMEAKLDSVHSLLVGKKSVQFAAEVETLGPEEKDVNYINGAGYQGQRFGSQQGYQKSDFQKPFQSNYQRNYGSSSYQTPPPKPSDSKMELMLEQLLEGQQQMTVNFNGKIDALYTDLNGKIEAINLHMKKLDTQVAQTAENVRRQEGFLPAKTETNPRLHVNAITLGSEKEVFQGCEKGLEEDEFVEIEENAELEIADIASIDAIGLCRSTQAQNRVILLEKTSASIDTEEVCRSTHPSGCYAIAPASSKLNTTIDTEVDATSKRKSCIDRRKDCVDRRKSQNCPISSKPSANAEERTYKPKIPYPRRSEQERFIAAIQDVTPEKPTQPTVRKLTKLASPGMFVVPCSIKGMKLKNSLCDTGANVNVIAEDVARELGIVDLQSSRMSIALADGSPTTSKGFIADLMLQVGDCIVPTDFHVMESRKGSNRPLILGRSFLATVGALVDFPNERISFSKINKDIFYPAVHDKEASCMSVTEGEKQGLEPEDDMKEKKDVLTITLSAARYGVTKPAQSKSKKIPKVLPLTPPPLRSDGDLTSWKVKRKGNSKPFSKFRIIIPLELKDKGEEVVQEMLQNTAKLFPGAFPCTIPSKT